MSKATVIFAFGLYVLASCASPRETCEWYETPDSWAGMCVLMSDLMISCPERVASGSASLAECEQETNIALLACARYIDAKAKCSKESDLPLIPKIVIRRAPGADRSTDFWESLKGTSVLMSRRHLCSAYSL